MMEKSDDKFRKEFVLRPLLVRAVVEALQAIFLEKRYADKVIEYTLRQNPKAGSRDRSFIAETCYEVVRNYRFYSEVLGKTPKSELDFWKLVGIHFLLQGHELPKWREFSQFKPAAIRSRATKLSENRAIAESIPDWLDELGLSELPDSWPRTLHKLNEPAKVVLRTNVLKTTPEELLSALDAERISAHRYKKTDAIVLNQRKNVFRTKAFKDGWFEVQDYSSQLVAPMLQPEPGMRVIDACAGGGGKTLHLAALMQSKGQLLALDTLDWKLKELKLRARRAGVSNIQIRPIESNKTIKRLHGTADRLLLDVPCSGLGVLRRNPDTKWKISPERIEELKTIQQQILRNYSKMLKPDGKMVYATCSVLPSENQEQVKAFLASEEGKGFEIEEERVVLPEDEGFDGFYVSLMRKDLS